MSLCKGLSTYIYLDKQICENTPFDNFDEKVGKKVKDCMHSFGIFNIKHYN